MSSKYERYSAWISSLYHDIQRIERMEMGKFGLKGPYAQCLLAISRFPEGVAAARLAEECEKDKAAISRTLAELIQNGLVLRNAGYRGTITLTEKGREAAETVSRQGELAVELAGEGLTEEEKRTCYRVLGHIAENLHALCKTGLNHKEETK